MARSWPTRPARTPARSPSRPRTSPAADTHTHAVRDVAVDGEMLSPHRRADRRGSTDERSATSRGPTPRGRCETLLATVRAAPSSSAAPVVTGWPSSPASFLARRALAPVADVTDTARAISLSGDFGARVEAGRPGDEVGELARRVQRDAGGARAQPPGAPAVPRRRVAPAPDAADHDPREPRSRQTAGASPTKSARRSWPTRATRPSGWAGSSATCCRWRGPSRAPDSSSQPVELDALLVDSVRRQRQAAPHVRMSVTAVEPALVDGDRDRLRELFGILLDNAARYTPAGGHVTAAIGGPRHGRDRHDRRHGYRVERRR